MSGVVLLVPLEMILLGEISPPLLLMGGVRPLRCGAPPSGPHAVLPVHVGAIGQFAVLRGGRAGPSSPRY